MDDQTPTIPEIETLRAEIPPEMQTARRWLVWKRIPAKPKPKKQPYYANGKPRKGKLDTPQDMAHLVTMEEAFAAFERGGYAGLGFALGQDVDGRVWQGIDLDNTTGRPELAALIDILPGYVERSPSGTGVHAIGCGTAFNSMGSNATGIEAYCRGRYFTVTGEALGGALQDLAPFVRDTLAPLHQAQAHRETETAPPHHQDLDPRQITELREALGTICADDYHVWVRMGLALSAYGNTGRGLWMTWSQSSDKFDPAQAAAKWDSFKSTDLDYRAVFTEAQKAGWVNPRARVATAQAPHDAERQSAETHQDPGPGAPELPEEDEKIGPYVWSEGIFNLARTVTVMVENKKERTEIKVPLANFSAVVAEQRLYDDGVETEHRTQLRVFRPTTRGTVAADVEILTSQFSGMAWVTNKLGHQYVVTAGSSVRDHLRAAIQSYSRNMVTRQIYTHTGWRTIDGELCYLHSGGAITQHGARDDIDVELEDNLTNYHLPHPPEPRALAEAVHKSLVQMRLGVDGIGAVQLARIYGPPLGAWYRQDFGIFVEGRSGTFKSEIAALAMAHYGSGWNARCFPESWSSTENAQLKKAFSVKNALYEIDDYNPQGTASDQQAMSLKADRVFRGAANQAGRGRMNADTRLRRTYFPRGMVSASGEDLPAGRSLRARMWILSLTPGTIDLDILTECQRYARDGTYASAMAGYVRWLASKADQLAAELPVRYEELRAEVGADLRDHERIPANLAGMRLSIEVFFRFVVDVGALSRDGAANWKTRCENALMDQARIQADLQETSEDAVRAMDLLRTAFTLGRVHVVDAAHVPAAKPPVSQPHLLGWKTTIHRHQSEFAGNDQSEDPGIELRHEALGEPIGYFVSQANDLGPQLWLNPDAAYLQIAKLAREQGAGAPRSQTRLAKALAERGFLHRGSGRDIGHKHNRANLSPARVWRMPLGQLLPSVSGEQTTPALTEKTEGVI